MTVRDAILLAVPVFAANQGRGPRAIRDGLERAGLPAPLAAEVVEFLPIALARALLDGLGIGFADHYIRRTARGEVIGQKALADEPVYREGLAIASELVGTGGDEFLAVAALSPEYQAINRAMNSGSAAGDIRCGPPVVAAGEDDPRHFDDTSGGRQPRAGAWWQVWK